MKNEYKRPMDEECQWRKSKSSGLSQRSCHSFSREITAFDIEIAAQLQKSWIPSPWRDQLPEWFLPIILLFPDQSIFLPIVIPAPILKYSQLDQITSCSFLLQLPKKIISSTAKFLARFLPSWHNNLQRLLLPHPTNLLFILIPHHKESSFPNYNT